MYAGMKPVHIGRVLEALKRQVFYIKDWGLERISDRLGAFPKPYFHNINSHTWYLSKTYRNLMGKTLRFTRNSKSKKEFSTKHPQVNFIWLGPFFWPWSLSFNIANHFLIDLWYIWLRKTIKIKPMSFHFEVFLF